MHSTIDTVPSLEQLQEAVLAVHSHTLPPLTVDSKKETIRASNRERKKKWRIRNEERNKDNDLRCRVNKRAAQLYGESQCAEKEQWAKDEFERRRLKRMEKEYRKQTTTPVVFTELQRQLLDQLNQTMLAIGLPFINASEEEKESSFFTF